MKIKLLGALLFLSIFLIHQQKAYGQISMPDAQIHGICQKNAGFAEIINTDKNLHISVFIGTNNAIYDPKLKSPLNGLQLFSKEAELLMPAGRVSKCLPHGAYYLYIEYYKTGWPFIGPKLKKIEEGSISISPRIVQFNTKERQPTINEYLFEYGLKMSIVLLIINIPLLLACVKLRYKKQAPASIINAGVN